MHVLYIAPSSRKLLLSEIHECSLIVHLRVSIRVVRLSLVAESRAISRQRKECEQEGDANYEAPRGTRPPTH